MGKWVINSTYDAARSGTEAAVENVLSTDKSTDEKDISQSALSAGVESFQGSLHRDIVSLAFDYAVDSRQK